MDLFAAAAACDNLGLLINTEKTVVMHQPPSETVYVTPQLNVGGVQLTQRMALHTKCGEMDARSSVTSKNIIAS
nr:unnamed protein product [Spirometra erinaceieuropaei]